MKLLPQTLALYPSTSSPTLTDRMVRPSLASLIRPLDETTRQHIEGQFGAEQCPPHPHGPCALCGAGAEAR